MRILLVEDQTLLRQHLLQYLSDCFPGSTITEAKSLADLKQLSAQNTSFELAVVDLDLPDGNALEWIGQETLKPNAPKIVILSAEHHEYVIYKALHANVSGFVHKNDEHAILLTALRAVLDGGYYFSPSVNVLRQKIQRAPDFFLKILSTREQHILRLVAQNYSDTEIAAELSLKMASVGSHRKNIMSKLDLHTRDQLVAYGKEKGFDRVSSS